MPSMCLDSEVNWYMSACELDFPEQKLSVADRLLVRNICRETIQAYHLTYPSQSIASTHFIVLMRENLKKYGFVTPDELLGS